MTVNTRVKAVLFDIDDTLFDRQRAQRDALRMAAKEFRHIFKGISEERMVDAFMESDRVSAQEFKAGASVEAARKTRMRRFLGGLGLDEEWADKVTAAYVTSYPRVKAMVPRARSVLRRLGGRFQLGVISNGSPDVQYHKLRTIGITSLLKCVVLSEETGFRKPDARIFLRAADALGMKPAECLYVGDSYDTDIIGARNAGMLACWFNPRGLPIPQAGIIPEFEVGALDEILRIPDLA